MQYNDKTGIMKFDDTLLKLNLTGSCHGAGVAVHNVEGQRFMAKISATLHPVGLPRRAGQNVVPRMHMRVELA